MPTKILDKVSCACGSSMLLQRYNGEWLCGKCILKARKPKPVGSKCYSCGDLVKTTISLGSIGKEYCQKCWLK